MRLWAADAGEPNPCNNRMSETVLVARKQNKDQHKFVISDCAHRCWCVPVGRNWCSPARVIQITASWLHSMVRISHRTYFYSSSLWLQYLSTVVKSRPNSERPLHHHITLLTLAPSVLGEDSSIISISHEKQKKRCNSQLDFRSETFTDSTGC